jgi:hypothetical protein
MRCVAASQGNEAVTTSLEGRLPHLVLGDVEVAGSGLGECAEDGLGVLLATRPLVTEVVDLALRRTATSSTSS